MVNGRRFLVSLLFVLMSTSTYALTLKVELLIFQQTSSAANNEAWDSHPGLPNFDKGHYLQSTSRGGYRQLGANTYSLAGAENSLDKRSDYRILKHVAWLQPAASKKRSRYIRLIGGNELNDGKTDQYGRALRELDGLVKVSLSKYPHIDLDLVLRDSGNNAPAYVAPDETTSYFDEDNPWQATPIVEDKTSAMEHRLYRLNRKQRLKMGEIFYIDHPLLGVLVKVSKLKS